MIQIVGPQLTQWDTGRQIKVSDSNATKAHFANQGDSRAVIMDIVDGQAKVPDYLLQTGKNLCVYLVLDGVTLESKIFGVTKREKPENYVYEEDQRNYIYELITNAENAINGASAAAESANQATANASIATENATSAASIANEAANNANSAAESATEAATKAAHTAKSLMVVGKAEGETIALDDAIEQYLVGLRVFGKTTQDGTPTPDAPVELVSAGDSGSISVNATGRNLLKNTAVSVPDMNGVAFTVNADRSITANGTAKADTYFVVNESVQVGNGEYYLTGCPAGGSASSYFLYISGLVQDFGNGVRSKLSGSHKIGICIKGNTTVTNLTFYPMLCPVSIANEAYEPYKGQTLALSTPNGLPGIPVPSGGNYTDANGQQWICDEVDFARGVYVHRTESLVISTKNSSIVVAWGNKGGFVVSKIGIADIDQCVMCDKLISQSSLGIYSGAQGVNANIGHEQLVFAFNGVTTIDELKTWLQSNSLTFLYAIKAATETPLSEEELAAYASLHTYRDNTTVFNDAGAWMDLEYVMDAKKYIDSLIGSGGSGGAAPARLASVTLPASKWAGSNSLYSQVVTIDGVTEYSKVDLLPSVEQLAIFHNKDVAFVTENEDGVVTVYAIGDKPTLDYTMQVSITEVEV